jgi:hypothetical protein
MDCISSQPASPPPPSHASTGDDLTGEQILDWWQQLSEKSTTFASILAAVLFSAIILDFDTIEVPHGSNHEVRTWAAAGAMIFVLLVLLCTGCSLGTRFHRHIIASMYEDKDWRVRYGLALGSFLFQGLLLAGTLFFCLVVTAYVPAIGWTVFGITSMCLLLSLYLWIMQLKTEIYTQCEERGKRKLDRARVNQELGV